MSRVIIFTDSTCDLTQDLLDQYQIKVIPLYVIFGEDKFKDRININTNILYEEVKNRGILPKTNPPSVSNFIEAFSPVINEGNDIIYLGISSKLSLTIENALLATKEFPAGRIHVIDTLNLSTGLGLLVLKAAKFAQQGLDAQKIVHRINKLIPKIETHFVIDTLDYLYMGGRCSGLTNFMSSLFKIKPIIQVKNGELSVLEKPIGKTKALDILLNKILDDQYILDEDFIIVTHSHDYEGVKVIKTGLKKNLPVKNIIETEAGCVVSSHCGKGTIGIIYLTD